MLTDGTRTYLYGLTTLTGAGRLAQEATTTEYFLGDAPRSCKASGASPKHYPRTGIGEGDTLRQMTDSTGTLTLEKRYTPFGEVLTSSGTGASVYGYTGEVTDPSGLVYLRARYYQPTSGIFISKDTWVGIYHKPSLSNKWVYANNNPIKYVDPTGEKFCIYEVAFQCISSKQELLVVLGRTVPINLAPGNHWRYTDAFIDQLGKKHYAGVSPDFGKNHHEIDYYTDECNHRHQIFDNAVYITDDASEGDINFLITVMSHEAGHTWIEYLREHSVNYNTAVYPDYLQMYEEIYINFVLLESSKITDFNKTILQDLNQKHFKFMGVMSREVAENELNLWYGYLSTSWLLSSIYGSY